MTVVIHKGLFSADVVLVGSRAVEVAAFLKQTVVCK